jgi:hypothetical protein
VFCLTASAGFLFFNAKTDYWYNVSMNVETMRGGGTVESKTGAVISVKYDLRTVQENVRGTNVGGLKDVKGWVRPVSNFGENGLLLTMQDGRKLKFFFADSDGSIALNEWIG